MRRRARNGEGMGTPTPPPSYMWCKVTSCPSVLTKKYILLKKQYLGSSENLSCLSCYIENKDRANGLCQNMKDVNTVFDERVKALGDTLKENNFLGCFRSTTDLTIFCTLAEFEDGVLISETFENVFYDLAYLFDTRDIDEKYKTEIVSALMPQLSEILKNYKTDINKAFFALKKMRFTATKFQLYWENKADKKPVMEMPE